MVGGEAMRICTSLAPASRTICTIFWLGGAAHDRIVDQHDALALEHAPVGVVLELDAHVADRVASAG